MSGVVTGVCVVCRERVNGSEDYVRTWTLDHELTACGPGVIWSKVNR